MPAQVITLEEHWATPEFLDGPGSFLPYPPHVRAGLVDVSGRRVEAMDAAGIDMQVLSLVVPGVEQMTPDAAIDAARRMNDYLAEHIAPYPERLKGFAVVPTPAPDRAVDELERALDDLGFVGVIINGHSAGRYLDDPAFQPLLDEIARREVPIYLHPAPSPDPVRQAWYGDLPQASGLLLATAGWGWHVETGLHVLRLILGGVFDRNPGLQVIIGHMGELVPFMVPRYDATMPPGLTGLAHPISHYLTTNVSYTFAGFNWAPTFNLLRDHIGVDRIMFSVDYPFFDMAESRAFLESLDLTAEDLNAIASGNAKRVLRL